MTLIKSLFGGMPRERDAAPPARAPRRRDTILVTGLPGSGKTSLVASSHFPTSAVAITFSDVMKELLAERHEGRHLRELWPQERSRIQIDAAQRIARRDPEKMLVIDGHLVVPTKKGWESGVPHEVWGLLRLVAIVVIFVPVQELVQRADLTLGPHPEYASDEVQIAQSYVHTTAAYYSSGIDVLGGTSFAALSNGCAFKCITNAQGRWDDAQKELADYVTLFL